MRLSPFEQQAIKAAATACFGADAQVRLFGSRTRDDRRGGDIDLLVDTSLSDAAAISRAQTDFLTRLYERLGEQKFDVLVDFQGRQSHPPIFAIARQEGIML
jgi:predicted nucleotidyltransferase